MKQWIVIDSPEDAIVIILKSIQRTLIFGFVIISLFFLLVVGALLIVAGEIQQMNANIEDLNRNLNGAVTMLMR